MEYNAKRNFSVSVATFILGAVFVLADQPGITSNVVGYNSGSTGLASVMGIIMIFASVALFIVHATHKSNSLEGQLKNIEKEELYTSPEKTDYGNAPAATTPEEIKKNRYK